MATSYCDYVKNNKNDFFNTSYHDLEYGFPIHDDHVLFERLVLEINQAGLSWITILKKKENFKIAYDNFEIKKVAGYGDVDVNRLLNDAGIIRNRLKIHAAIENARRIIVLQEQHGSFKNWLDAHHPKSKEEWVKLFKKQFKFTGGEIVNEFLMSTGYLPGAHDETCPVFKAVKKHKPVWMQLK